MTLVRQKAADTPAPWGTDQTTALERGLRKIGVDATPGQQAQLRHYGELLLKWNRTYNLLGATSAQAMVEEHLLDSLAVLPALRAWLPVESSVMVDVGTGAGLPGIVLSIMRADLPIILVEPIGKKAAFLQQAVAECRLPEVTVMPARIEDVPTAQLRRPAQLAEHGSDGTGRTTHFICRAFTSLDRFATLCAPHLQHGSLLFAMKAAKVEEELEQLTDPLEVLAVQPLRTIEKDVPRNLVVMRSKETHPAADPTGPVR